jgi:hypothetical protein
MPLSKGRAAIKSWLFKVVRLAARKKLACPGVERPMAVSICGLGRHGVMCSEALAWRPGHEGSEILASAALSSSGAKKSLAAQCRRNARACRGRTLSWSRIERHDSITTRQSLALPTIARGGPRGLALSIEVGSYWLLRVIPRSSPGTPTVPPTDRCEGGRGPRMESRL